MLMYMVFLYFFSFCLSCFYFNDKSDKQRLPFNHRQKVYPNGTLLLVEVDRILDEGSYTCVALAPGSNGKNGIASSTLHLSVQMKPVIDPFTFSKTLHEGQRYNVLCSVTRGDSPLTIKWFKDGRLLGPSTNHQVNMVSSSSAEYSGINVIQITEYSSTLIFESLRPDHRGNYTCQASNRAGSAAITQSMIVHGTCCPLLSFQRNVWWMLSLTCPLRVPRNSQILFAWSYFGCFSVAQEDQFLCLVCVCVCVCVCYSSAAMDHIQRRIVL